MNLKQKVKTYSFWISIISAVLIVVRIIGEYFGWFINEGLIMDIVTGICGILVLLGILSSPTNKDENMEETIKNLKEQSTQIQTQQKELTQTIKTDIMQKQLSIEEQIALLKQNAATVQTAEPIAQTKPKVEETVDTETQTYGIEFEQKPETVESETQAESKAYETSDLDLQAPDTEEILLGMEIEDQTVEETELTTEDADVAEIKSIAELQNKSLLVDVDLENWAEPVDVDVVITEDSQSQNVLAEDGNAEEFQNEIKQEPIEELNFAELSNAELKALLVEILQRL